MFLDRDSVSGDDFNIKVLEIRRLHVSDLHDHHRDQSIHEQHFHNHNERGSIHSHLSSDIFPEDTDAVHQQMRCRGGVDHKRHHDTSHHIVFGRGERRPGQQRSLQLQHNMADQQFHGFSSHETIKYVYHLFLHINIRDSLNINIYMLRVSHKKASNGGTQKQKQREEKIS